MYILKINNNKLSFSVVVVLFCLEKLNKTKQNNETFLWFI
jgi:hypothetical protein